MSNTDAVSARWSVRSNILHIETGGETICPTADEIYALIFDGAQMFRGTKLQLEPGPIRFSRYPAFLDLIIDQD